MTAITVLRAGSPCRPHPPISEAQPGSPGQPNRAEPRSPRSGALDSPAKRSYRFHPTPPRQTRRMRTDSIRRSVALSQTHRTPANGVALSSLVGSGRLVLAFGAFVPGRKLDQQIMRLSRACSVIHACVSRAAVGDQSSTAGGLSRPRRPGVADETQQATFAALSGIAVAGRVVAATVRDICHRFDPEVAVVQCEVARQRGRGAGDVDAVVAGADHEVVARAACR